MPPPPAAAASGPPPPAPAEGGHSSTEERFSRLENLFSNAMTDLIDRIAVFTAKPIHRPARRGSGRSPSRARGGATAPDAQDATTVANKAALSADGVPPNRGPAAPGGTNQGPNGPGDGPPTFTQAPTETPPLTCSNCGAIQVPNAAYCWQCGQAHIRIIAPPKAKPTAVPKKHCWSEPDPPDDDDDDDDEYQEEGEEEEEEEFFEPDEVVEDDTPPPPYCTTCGTQFPTGPGSNFCSVCGATRPASGNPTCAVAPKVTKGPGSGAPSGAPPGPDLADGPAASVTSSAARKRKEAQLVKQRGVESFKLPKLAGDAAEQRGWLNAFLAYVRRFDATSEGNFLWKWANKAFRLGVTEKDLRDPEGCPNLDALIASEIMQNHHYAIPPF